VTRIMSTDQSKPTVWFRLKTAVGFVVYMAALMGLIYGTGLCSY